MQGGSIAGVRSALRGSGALYAAVLALAVSADTARAGPDGPHTELFTGIETSDNYTSGYVGGGYAFGKGLYAPGLRLRAVGAYGRYDYDGALFDGSNYVATTFDGQDSFAAALIGYQFDLGTGSEDQQRGYDLRCRYYPSSGNFYTAGSLEAVQYQSMS